MQIIRPLFGAPTGAGIPARVGQDAGSGTRAGELNVLLYPFSVTIIYMSDPCRTTPPKTGLYKHEDGAAPAGGNRSRTAGTAPLSLPDRSRAGRIESGPKTQYIRRLYELSSIVWA